MIARYVVWHNQPATCNHQTRGFGRLDGLLCPQSLGLPLVLELAYARTKLDALDFRLTDRQKTQFSATNAAFVYFCVKWNCCFDNYCEFWPVNLPRLSLLHKCHDHLKSLTTIARANKRDGLIKHSIKHYLKKSVAVLRCNFLSVLSALSFLIHQKINSGSIFWSFLCVNQTSFCLCVVSR